MKRDRSVGYSATVIAAMAFVVWPNDPAWAGAISQEMRRYVQHIPLRNDNSVYSLYVEDWCGTLGDADASTADKRDIRSVTSVLGVNIPEVRSCAVAYLARVGPGARSAVPRLQKLYDLLRCGKIYDMIGSGQIYQALYKIGMDPIVASCERGRPIPKISSPVQDEKILLKPLPPPPDSPKDDGR
jgi:hypothetical protein